MKQEHIDYINYIEGIKTTLKNTHWSSKNNSEHVRMDEFADIVSEFEDKISEEFQGIEGQIQDNQVQPKEYTFTNVETLLNNIKDETLTIYKNLQDDIEYIGICSEIESFIHDINKYKYLFRLSLKNESKIKENYINLTDTDLKNIVNEAIRSYLKKIIN